MTPKEKWDLIKMYDPDRTPIQEIKSVNDLRLKLLQDFCKNSDNWDFIRVEDWKKEVSFLGKYKDFLKSVIP